MNLLFLFLSIIFSTVAPDFSTGGNNENGGTTQTETGGTKKDKFGEGEFIIFADDNP